MRLSPNFLKLTGITAEKFMTYSNYTPTPMTLKTFIAFGETANQERSYKFLREELPVRLANIMQEIHLLPDSLLEMPSVKTVVGWYEHSFNELMTFEKRHSKDYATLTDFTDTLDSIRERHINVVETMARGVLELKDLYGIDPVGDIHLQYFLDRFYASRISIRMLIHQHVLLFGGHLNEDLNHIGSINPKCNVTAVIQDALRSSRLLCEGYFERSPPEVHIRVVDTQTIAGKVKPATFHGELDKTDLENPACLEMVYVPTHLYHMVFELLKNAMRAVMDATPDSATPLPIEVLVCGGKEDITINVSDRGSGIPRSALEQVFGYTYSTAPAPDAELQRPPLAGYGYGLPLSRLYARYLSGNLQLTSAEGYGTQASIYLKRRAADAEERVPVFNTTSARHYQSDHSDEDGWCGSRNGNKRSAV